jgi:parvulin-like peptidyl-prolyl isomerase
VAIVNGQSIFLDDVLGGVRHMIESNPQLSDDQRQAILLNELGKRLSRYTEDQLIIQAVERKIPADRRKDIRASLEPKFDEVLESILKKENKATSQELDEWLATQGTSVDELRENFFRIQMVEGYVTSLAKVPEKIDREELLRYYNEHLADYTAPEQIRFSKIVVRFEKHGGQSGADELIAQIVSQLNQSRDFGDVAAEFSDASNREKRGDMGWIKRGALTPELEELLFALEPGSISSVQTYSDRFELFHISDRKESSTVPFADVQKEIEEQLLTQKRTEARQTVRDQIRNKGNITTVIEPAVKTTSATGPIR